MKDRAYIELSQTKRMSMKSRHNQLTAGCVPTPKLKIEIAEYVAHVPRIVQLRCVLKEYRVSP